MPSTISVTPERTTVPITEATPEALAAFFGAGNAKRANTVKAHVSPGEREQEILTPSVLIEAILKVWPHIALDPCWAPRSVVGALRSYYTPASVELTKTGKPKVVYTPVPGAQDGLTLPWCDYTFANPPFKFLQDWLYKARVEGDINEHETMVLCPNRTNRTWFRDVRDSCTEVCELNPVKFVGYKQAFPDRLVMLYWGENSALFREAFSGKIGDCRR